MKIDDLILVSTDDHVIEPPHLFEGRLPAKYADAAPKFVTRGGGTMEWVYMEEMRPGAEVAAAT